MQGGGEAASLISANYREIPVHAASSWAGAGGTNQASKYPQSGSFVSPRPLFPSSLGGQPMASAYLHTPLIGPYP